jgi:hypothetical protein
VETFPQGSYNVLVMDLLGYSLEDFFNRCGRRFSLVRAPATWPALLLFESPGWDALADSSFGWLS